MADAVITVMFKSAGVPQVGLTPTIRIWAINAGSPQSDVLVVGGGSPLAFMEEVGDGFYKYNFNGYDPRQEYVFRADGGAILADTDRFCEGGTECADPEEIADATWNATATDYLTIGSTGALLNNTNANTNSLVISNATIESLVNTLLQYEIGRTRIDTTNNTLTIYDTDCVTPLRVFELRDQLGNPSVTEVCERFPIGPGSPSCAP